VWGISLVGTWNGGDVMRVKAKFWKLGGGLASVAAVGFLFAVASPVAAQQSRGEIRDLKKQIVRIEKQLRAVQKRVFGKDFPSVEELEKAAAEAGQRSLSTAELLAGMEVRITSIDRQMRQLTGKIEEFEFQQSRLLSDIGKLQEDIEFRFRELEQKAAAAPKEKAAGRTPRRSPFVETESPEEAEQQLRKAEAEEREFKARIEAARLPAGSPEEQYEFAQDLMRRGDYEAAEKAFSSFISAHSDHVLTGNAQYWLGETFYVRKDYPRAAEAFLIGYEKYGDRAKGPDSLLKLGLTMAGMGQNDEACTILRELEIRYVNATQRIKSRAEAEARRLSCP
jgi:tol-pal system protein YbgF